MWNLIPFQAKLAVIACTAIGMGIAGYMMGYKNATSEYAPKLYQLKAQVEQADQVAQDTKTKQERANVELELSHKKRLDDIAAYYRRMSVRPGSAVSASTPSVDTPRDAGTTSEPAITRCDPEPTITTCPAEVEERCAKDAARVNWCKDFFIKHQFPVDP